MTYCCLMLLSTSSVAQQSSQSAAGKAAQIRVYQRDYFDPYNPQTARDIIDRIPGFSFDPGDNLRGFGAAAGNVLVDGVRPTSKSGGIEDALTRIPANDVARIEVIRGAAGTSEATGQSLVANIIRVGQGRVASWRLKIERNSEGTINPLFEGSLAAPLGDWSTSTKLTAFWEEFDLVGRRDRFDANGNLTLAQTEDRPSVLTEGFISSEAIRQFDIDTLTLSARAGISGFLPDTERFQFDDREPDAVPDGSVTIDFDSVRWTGEASVDWVRKLSNDWSFKMLLLATAAPLDQTTSIRNERPVPLFSGGSNFRNRQFPIESIIRSTMARAGNRKLKPEFGMELAYNRLDSEFELLSIDADGSASPVLLPAANVLVEEIRAEAFSNLIWAMSPQWTVETGIAIEASSISVSGDAENKQSFFFAKPFANLLYRPSESLQVQLSMRRSVGQLDFGDFAASADGEQDREFGGNPDLAPDQNWRASMSADWRRESSGALNIELFHEWRDNVLEQVRLPSDAFGLGNAGSARVWGLIASASVQMQPIIPGGLLEVRATLQDSKFMDPLIGRTRDLNNIPTPSITMNFRQDIPVLQWSWGINYIVVRNNDFFFGNELSRFREGSQLELFAETTRYFDIKSRLALRGVGGRNFRTERLFFSPDRAGSFIGTEQVDRDRGMFITLTLEGQSS